MEIYKEALINLNLSNFNQAIHKFEQAIQLKVNLQESMTLKSESYFLSSNYLKALTSYEEMITKFPTLETGYTGKAFILTIMGNYSEVDKLYEKAMSINEKNWKTYFYCGYSLSKRKKYEQALKMYEKAITKNPLNHPICYVARSEIWCHNKNFSASRKEIKYALKSISETENHKNLYKFQINEIEECLKEHEKVLNKLDKLLKEKSIKKVKKEEIETELTEELTISLILNNPALYKLFINKLIEESLTSTTTEETYDSNTSLPIKPNKIICECSNCEIF